MTKTAHNLALAIVFAVLAGGRFVSAADWVSLKSTAGRFSAIFPAQPKEAADNTKSGPVSVVLHSFTVDTNGFEYAALWNDYQPEFMLQTTPVRLFDGIARGLNAGGKKVLSDKAITISGNPARSFEVDNGNGLVFRLILVMSEDRLYQVMTYAPVAHRDDPSIAKFMDGFALWPVLDFPARGFRIEGVELAGWTRGGPDNGRTVVIWAGADSTPDHLRAYLMIDAARGTMTAAQTAQALAGAWGGKVSAEKLLLDGEPAFKIEAVNNTQAVQPVVGIIATHGGFLYAIKGCCISGRNVSAPIDQLAKGWRWEPIVAPCDQLDFFPAPIDTFNGAAIIDYPQDLHAEPTQDPGRILDVSLFDMRENGDVFDAIVQLAPVEKGADFAVVKNRFLTGMKEKKLLDDRIVWAPRNGDDSRVITACSRDSAESERTKRDVWHKWGLIKFDHEQIVLMTFTIVSRNDTEKPKFEAAAERMVDWVRPRSPETRPAGN